MTDTCQCGKRYNFILTDFPESINGYKVLAGLSRGFYGATFVVAKGTRRIKRVLKVTPKAFYVGRTTTFEQEVDNHFTAADGADFIVQITEDPFETTILFNNESIDCHCIEMDFIEGYVLSDIYSGRVDLTPELATQVACDLMEVLRELQQRSLNHNDLHSGNIIIEILTPSAYRADAIERGVRATAIDLGSVDSQRREGGTYLSDVQWISEHLLALSKILSENNPGKSDLRARVAFALRQLSSELRAPQINQSDQSYQDLIDIIRSTYQSARQKHYRAWNVPLQLSSFAAQRNAQTFESWYVPRLMVDPEEKWLAELNSGGPVVLTGMRGCGKTMLLRSLEVHARIVAVQSAYSDKERQKEALVKDGYLGVFASARHLGSSFQESSKTNTDQEVVSGYFGRLFLVYTRRLCDALTHLEEVFPGTVDEDAAIKIGAVVFGQIRRMNPLSRTATLDELQTHLLLDAELWSSDYGFIELVAEPWNAFVLLAQAVQSVLRGINVPQITFLLDDVSTRYLQPRQIELVVSTLLVQDPSCSFKITSETQTFFLSIKSPAQINHASDERDFLAFDLGSKVLQQLKNKSQGSEFLEKILKKRMTAMGGDLSAHSPKQILGDIPLVSIARAICANEISKSSSDSTYHGFSALRGVCVGDLGTVIAIYQEIIKKAIIGNLPVAASHQHAVFQSFCSNQLFLLNSRDGKEKSNFSLKRVALEFAEASHEELMASFRNDQDRLRQITTLNVTLDEGDTDQAEKLLQLVDAGVFALHPRKLASRTKSQASDPVLQFQLSFRKILGLSKLIGLSDRDRFELNGKQLLDWLSGSNSKINLRAHTRRYGADENEAIDTPDVITIVGQDLAETQPAQPAQSEMNFEIASIITKSSSSYHLPSVDLVDIDKLERVDNLIVSLGFEELCFPSAERLAQTLRPRNIIAIEYPIPGRFEETKDLAERVESNYRVVKFDDLQNGLDLHLDGLSLVDTSGLTKPAIYKLIKSEFARSSRVYAAITEPTEYHPTEEDIANAIGDGQAFWGEVGVDRLSGILSGDKLPYSVSVIDFLQSDPARNLKLCAFGSAKHGRLIYLVDEVVYDEIDVMIPSGDSARSLVARKAANIATGGGELGSVIEYPPEDPKKLLNEIFINHRDSYYIQRSNFEIALTGGKLEAILSGIAGACLPINRVLYVKPNGFDSVNFSSGFGSTRIYSILQ